MALALALSAEAIDLHQDDRTKSLVVLIHGWTAKSDVPADYNWYKDTADAPELNYLTSTLKLKLANS